MPSWKEVMTSTTTTTTTVPPSHFNCSRKKTTTLPLAPLLLTLLSPSLPTPPPPPTPPPSSPLQSLLPRSHQPKEPPRKTVIRKSMVVVDASECQPYVQLGYFNSPENWVISPTAKPSNGSFNKRSLPWLPLPELVPSRLTSHPLISHYVAPAPPCLSLRSFGHLPITTLISPCINHAERSSRDSVSHPNPPPPLSSISSPPTSATLYSKPNLNSETTLPLH